MDSSGENISQKDMLEKIAELDHSQSHLRELNAEMRQWLDAADDDNAVLRLENANLRKQLNDIERILTELQQVESEPCGPLLGDGLCEKQISEKRIQDLERETLKWQEENKELTVELKNVKQQRDQDRISLRKLRNEFENLEIGVEELQLELQHRDELINQKHQHLKHLEETVEEYSNIIKELRLAKQELSNQLEDRQVDATFTTVAEVMTEEEGQPSPQLSIAEEIKLLFSSAEMKPCINDSEDPASVISALEQNGEGDDEGPLEHQGLTDDVKPKSRSRFADAWRTAVQKLLKFYIISLCVLAFVVLGFWVGNSDFCLNSSLMKLPPYVTVRYKALPPI
ncbi:GRIP1-associated protein 1-like [Cyprinodon tularosa]|uniref:GRIP1-associated protein 1-like n=1 Tax=Cyprinodon tularosa TaxID=77115 RepID=UPI0018E23AAB|nr:GRIP1-associated protein 1-like [Cyprinodon tularosa]XP_038142453.1 GRIP1-associated protein 1-like [Cyprinodon tularosa]